MGKSRIAVASCMRNEGMFVLEWVAYHHAIGFDDIYIVTNDCTDGSDHMLDRLQALGYVTHIRSDKAADEAPQVAGMRQILALPAMDDTAWLLHIDADEFLNVTTGAGRVQDLVAVAGEADDVAILWRPFGHGGQGFWNGGSVLREFTMAQDRPRKNNAGHKSMFRPDKFERAIDHMPKGPRIADAKVVNTRGVSVTNAALYQPGKARYRMGHEHHTWDNACINHYAIKSQDVFLMKNDRGDGMALQRDKYHLHSLFYRRHNKNAVEDRSILRHIEQVEDVIAEMLGDAEIARRDAEALAHFRARRDVVLTPEQIVAWSKPAPDA